MRFSIWMGRSALVVTAILSFLTSEEDGSAQSADPIPSVHAQQMAQIESEPLLEPGAAPDPAVEEALRGSPASPGRRSTTPTPSLNFISFGYAQSYGSSGTYTDFYRYNALTHIGSTFITFNSSGVITNPSTWTGRDAQLRAGGAAQAAGTKVIMVVLNSGFDVTVINSVMTSASARTQLVTDIVNLLQADSYSHGVSFDFEPFSWSSAARDGMTLFFQELRTALDTAGLNNHEISIYGDPTPSSTQWDLPGFEPNLDYILYSCYDFATGSTPTAISRFRGTGIDYLTQVNDFYLDGGFPHEKMVMTISAYSRRWDNGTYGVSGATNDLAQGFTDGLYDTTMNPNFGGPYADNYVTDHQAGWHTWNDGTPRIRTWESPEAFEYEIRHVLSNQDDDGIHNGRRLGGVGFWSLIWLAETTSYDPIAASSSAKTRMYPHIFQLLEEILAPPGTTRYTAEGFEALNFRWRDPNEGPDDSGDTDTDSTRALVATPAGGPPGHPSTNAMRVTFDFEAGSGNRLFFRHEPLRNNAATSVNDRNAVIAVFDSTTAVHAQMYTPAAYSGRTVRMVVQDGNGQLETSPTFTLNATGWREITFDLTAGVTAYTTAEPGFSSGNGTLNTAGGGARDIAFVGWLIEGGGAGAGEVTFDELQYEHRNPGGLNYKINEFRYNASASEFVEIHGPAGAIPASTVLRFHSPVDGSVLSSVDLGGVVVPADGHLVIGDTGVPNVDLVPPGWGAADNIPNTDPSSMQIYNTATGCVYDSVVYEAAGGLDDLIRASTLGVTGEGYPWIGEVGPGTTAGGTPYTLGRYPSGTDTNWNFADFSFMPATPGAANGGSVSLGQFFDFTTAPANAYAAYQSFAVASPAGAGLPASPGGGNAHRCVDTSGGGQITMIGDAALGAGGGGYTVTGDLYIPALAAPAQAIGIGICGRQGSTFFTANPSASGYESGYWLIYENGTVGLNDGRPDHDGVFEFVHASNDRMDANPVDLLASRTLASAGVSRGTWVPFSLTVNPSLVGQQLIIQINGVDVYRGNLPAGGPTSGAFQIGFRENHSGGPVASEGTWVDSVTIGPAVPVELSGFMVD
ncbi:MAG: hypothetical protein HUU25_01910 [Candidatus Sumerlaeia bacterium]|nr:hypothetical protein [Candidatus Sumerlaeia bacterium]